MGIYISRIFLHFYNSISRTFLHLYNLNFPYFFPFIEFQFVKQNQERKVRESLNFPNFHNEYRNFLNSLCFSLHKIVINLYEMYRLHFGRI